MNDEIIKILKISGTEFKVYETLLELGVSSALEISKYLSIPRSTVHHALKKLIDKNLVKKSENISKKYKAESPQRIGMMFDEAYEEQTNKLSNLVKLKKDLDSFVDKLLKNKEFTPPVKFYLGRNNIIKAYKKMLSSTKTIKTYANAEWVTKEIPEIRKGYLEMVKKMN